MLLQRLVTHSSLARHERHEDGGKKTRKTVRKQESSEKNSTIALHQSRTSSVVPLHPAVTLSLSLFDLHSSGDSFESSASCCSEASRLFD